jgi:hypothetical protein
MAVMAVAHAVNNALFLVCRLLFLRNEQLHLYRPVTVGDKLMS